MNSAEIFSRNVKLYLKKRGIKIKELAEQIGISDSYLSLVLNNNRGNLNDAYKDKIALILKTSVAELYSEVEEDYEDLIQVIDSQQDELEKKRTLYLRILDDALFLLANEHLDLRSAFYYGFGSLTEEEAIIVARFLHKVLEKYFGLHNEDFNFYDSNLMSLPKEQADKSKMLLKKIRYEISDESKRILALLAIIGDVCSVRILQELTGSSLEILISYLRELAKNSLIEIMETEEDTILRFHDKTIERAAYNLIEPTYKSKIHHKIALLLESTNDDCYANLTKIAYHYKKSGCIDKSLEYSLKAAESAYALRQYRHCLKHYGDASILLKYKERNDDLAQVYQRIGTIHRYLLNEEEALAHFDDSYKLYHKLKNDKGAAHALCEIGAIWYFRNEIKKAISYYKKSLSLLQNLNDKDELFGIVLIRLGSAYGRQEEFTLAQEYYKKAMTFASDMGHHYNILGQALTGLGLIAKRQRNWEEAIGFYVKALQETDNNSIRTKAMSFGNLGLAYLNKGSIDEAIEALSKSIEFYDKVADVRYGAYASIGMAKAYLQKGDLSGALRYIEEVIPVLRQAKDKLEMAEVYRLIGHIKRLKNEWKGSLRLFEESIKLLQDFKWKTDSKVIAEQLAQVYYDFGVAFNEKGDMDRCDFYLRKAYNLCAQYQLNIKYLKEENQKYNAKHITQKVNSAV